MKSNQYNPESISHPGKTLALKIKEIGVSSDEFAYIIKVSNIELSQIISGVRDINFEIAERLEQALKIPAHFWISRQLNYNQQIDNINKNI